MGGRLVLVATPLGNLGDLAPRAVETLAGADVVACEDTRRTGRLLAAAGIEAPRLVLVNDQTESRVAPELAARVVGGEVVALVSDAGLPTISDPGVRVVRAVVELDGEVSVVPGPSAASAALAVSGFGTDRWCFEGFLPRKGPARRARLEALAAERRTSVLYEAPHRVRATLSDLAGVCGADRRVVLVRELTKLHETVWRGTLGEAVEGDDEPRGEFVLVLHGAAAPEPPSDERVRAALARERAAGSTTRDAVDAVVAALGVPRRRVYALATADDGVSPSPPRDGGGGGSTPS